MTGTEIQSRAARYLDFDIDDDDALEAINECLSILGDRGLIYGMLTYEVEANKWYTLSSDVTLVTRTTRLSGDSNYYDYYDYYIEGDSILFMNDGTYNIHYRRLPSALARLSDTPDIPELYHQCIVTYLKGWARQKDEDGFSEDGQRLLLQFQQDAQQVYATLSRRHGPNQWQVVRHA